MMDIWPAAPSEEWAVEISTDPLPSGESDEPPVSSRIDPDGPPPAVPEATRIDPVLPAIESGVPRLSFPVVP
jgi:hypothetical protein